MRGTLLEALASLRLTIECFDLTQFTAVSVLVVQLWTSEVIYSVLHLRYLWI